MKKLLITILILIALVGGNVWAVTVDWMGYTWDLREGPTGGPGFGLWTSANVDGPDGSGFLTIQITNPTGSSPIGAEMDSQTTGLGYGTYKLVTGSRLDNLDKNIVFGGLFPYYGGSPAIEFDVGEVSSWDGADAEGYGVGVNYVSHNSWYNDFANRTHSTAVMDSGEVHTFVFKWEAGQATYDTYIGADTCGTLLKHSVHTTSIPVPSTEIAIINLWLYDNDGAATAAAADADDIDAPAKDIILRSF